MILPLPYFHILRILLFKYPTPAVTRLCSLMVVDCVVYDESRIYVLYLNSIFRVIYTDVLSNDLKSEQKESSCAYKVSSKCLKSIFTLALELKSRISYSSNSNKYVMLQDNGFKKKMYLHTVVYVVCLA